MAIRMCGKIKRETTKKNITLRNKNFIHSVQKGEYTKFDVMVMQQYKAYAVFFPFLLINDFIRKHEITDASYIQFHHLCKVVNAQAIKRNPKFVVRIGRKRVKKGRFAKVRFYCERFLLAVYDAIRQANLVEKQKQVTMEAC
ncbi:hypothetical protein [Pseudomonas haemolytica]|jgi:hypothetical protein|uniref:Uncharacterized protein n=1 Tax=Pseudomonas haemolytica TaxID=2600065 RepID=A0ABS1H0B6_9PSED|nr:hypothetical protein [Pseudomonas haemolytica]MBK3462657.1 hypothetical protein [Pseudomonas haemolytica]